jgi:1,4-dihydroxy-6-naphthoate synthase
MQLSLGFSPCPNDTFIFDALVNQKIDTEGLDFEPCLEDVQTLNQWAMEKKLDITKISYGVLPLVLENYDLLDGGGALGKGVGPLLISKRQIPLIHIKDCLVAVPGKNTTANLLLSMAFPEALHKQYMVFSEIENAIISEKADCGVIIHENRFTYAQKGLIKLIDLGEFWEEKTGCPIPLGGIVINNKYESPLRQKVDSLIKKSVAYAFSNYPLLSDYVKTNAQEMDENIMRQHIDLYVNNYSISLGEDGRNAVSTLLKVYAEGNSTGQLRTG